MSFINRQENRISRAKTAHAPVVVDAGNDGLNPIGKIAAWSAAHRWWVIVAFVTVLASAMFVLSSVETKLLDYYGEGESAIGAKLVENEFKSLAAPTEQLIFSNPSMDAESPAFRFAVQGVVDQLSDLPEVESVVSYYDTGSEEMVSDDGHVVLAQLVIKGESDLAKEKIEAILDAVYAANASETGFEIGIAGESSLTHEFKKIEEEDFASMIMITMILALSLMLFAFRGVVAALLPLVLALGSIITALGIAALVSQVYPMPEFLAQVVLLMGMAVGVDYSLFIVSRYRTERKADKPKLEAIASACNTTGRAVFYAGITVVLSLVGLMFTGSAVFISMSIGVIIVVLVALLASLTLLPAMLAALGEAVNWLRLPIIGRDRGQNNGGGIWGWITDRVLARPGVLAIITGGLLIALVVPVLSLNLGTPIGSDSLHDSVQSKRAIQLMEEHFSAGIASPAYVVVDHRDVNSASVQDAVAEMLRLVEADNSFSSPFETRVNSAGNLLYVSVPLVGGTDEDLAEDAVGHLRQDVIPSAFAMSDAQVYVSGATAGSLDFTSRAVSTAPYVFGFVLGLSFLLLLVMFRSIIIPFKAIALNMLSVGAAYGVMVMVFQWGWGISILGSEATGVINPFLPLFIFAILFGLSMDYHMLLLNRIKEAYDQGHSNEDSVSMGIKLTAGQITSAAAIMVGIFLTFALGRSVVTQQLGVGLGVAVLIDATIIRSVLLPASMKLLGDRNWYLPSWLEWIPNLGSSESGKDRQVATEAVPAMADD